MFEKNNLVINFFPIYLRFFDRVPCRLFFSTWRNEERVLQLKFGLKNQKLHVLNCHHVGGDTSLLKIVLDNNQKQWKPFLLFFQCERSYQKKNHVKSPDTDNYPPMPGFSFVDKFKNFWIYAEWNIFCSKRFLPCHTNNLLKQTNKNLCQSTIVEIILKFFGEHIKFRVDHFLSQGVVAVSEHQCELSFFQFSLFFNFLQHFFKPLKVMMECFPFR